MCANEYPPLNSSLNRGSRSIMVWCYFLQTLRAGLGGDVPEVRPRRLAAVQGVPNVFASRLSRDGVFLRHIVIII